MKDIYKVLENFASDALIDKDEYITIPKVIMMAIITITIQKQIQLLLKTVLYLELRI